MKKSKIIRVFVASPGDVKQEREILEEIIKELNDSWSESLGLFFQLIKWETHSYPDVGTDPQSVINNQIGDDYEVFIGILWSRFGTPTPRAESGTIEEFERAYSRYEENPDNIKVMFYFKDQPVPPSKIDPTQLSKIIEFKNKLGELGTLHWSFDNTEEFSKYLRMHLSRQMQYWKDRPLLSHDTSSIAKDKDNEMISITDEPETIEEDGFLDLVEIGTENFETLNEVSERMTEEMYKLAEYTKENTEALKEIDVSQGKGEVKKAKRLVNQMAGQLEIFNKRFDAEIPLYRKHFFAAIDSFGKATTLLTDFGTDVNDDINDALSAIKDIRVSSNSLNDAIGPFRDVISHLPRVTTRFNRAKRQCISILELFEKEVESGIKLTTEVEMTMTKLLN